MVGAVLAGGAERAAPGPGLRGVREAWARAVAADAEHERGDAGCGDDEHRDFAERVPRADVDEGDVDRVLTVSEEVGDLREAQPDRVGHACVGGVCTDDHDRDADADRDPGAGADESAHLCHVRRERAQHEHEHDHHERLDEHLRDSEVRGAVEGEDRADREAGDGNAHDRGEAVVQHACGEHGDRDGDDERVDHRRRSELDPQSLAGADEQRQHGENDERRHDDDDVERQRTALDERGEPQRGLVAEAEDLVVDAVGVTERRLVELEALDGPLGDVENNAEQVHHGGEEQREREPVPQAEVVRVVRGPLRAGRECDVDELLEQRLQRRRVQAEGEPAEREDRRHREEPERRCVRRGHRRGAAEAVVCLAAQRAHDQASRVGEGEHGADDEDTGDDRSWHAVQAGVLEHRGERGLLADEADERRQARHRGGGEYEEGRERGPTAAETRQVADVAGAGLVVDDADRHEQRRLEQRMRDEHREAGEHGVAGADAHENHEEAELGDGAEREDQLEVVLSQAAPARHEQGDGAEADEDDLPRRRPREPRRQARDEEDARLDHRRRMQVGGDRRGRGHGAGKPEVEGCDGRFRDRAEDDEKERDAHGRPGGLGGDDVTEKIRADGFAEDHDAHEHRQTAECGDEQGLRRGAAGGRALGVVADEQERQDRGQFPEDVHDQHVVGHDEAEHDERECRELAGEQVQARFVVGKIEGAVEQHERADAERDERHEHRQGIHAQREREREGFDPVVAHLGFCSPLREHPDRAGRGHERDDRKRFAAEKARERDR